MNGRDHISSLQTLTILTWWPFRYQMGSLDASSLVKGAPRFEAREYPSVWSRTSGQTGRTLGIRRMEVFFPKKLNGKNLHLKMDAFTQEFQVPKMEGFLYLIRPFFLGGVGKVPLHKPYLYSLYYGEDSSILRTNEMLGDGWNTTIVSFWVLGCPWKLVSSW